MSASQELSHTLREYLSTGEVNILSRVGEIYEQVVPAGSNPLKIPITLALSVCKHCAQTEEYFDSAAWRCVCSLLGKKFCESASALMKQLVAQQITRKIMEHICMAFRASFDNVDAKNGAKCLVMLLAMLDHGDIAGAVLENDPEYYKEVLCTFPKYFAKSDNHDERNLYNLFIHRIITLYNHRRLAVYYGLAIEACCECMSWISQTVPWDAKPVDLQETYADHVKLFGDLLNTGMTVDGLELGDTKIRCGELLQSLAVSSLALFYQSEMTKACAIKTCTLGLHMIKFINEHFPRGSSAAILFTELNDLYWADWYIRAVKLSKIPRMGHDFIQLSKEACTSKNKRPNHGKQIRLLDAIVHDGRASMMGVVRRHCGAPGCQVSTATVFAQLRKCKRCRAAYYCGVECQKQHWPVHRLQCHLYGEEEEAGASNS